MKRGGILLVVGTAAVICFIAAAVSTAIPNNGKKYEVEAVVDVSSEYKTDAARTIDLYERLMDRYMDLSEKVISQMDGDCQSVSAKMNSLDARLTDILTRLTRIEKALGIDPNTGTVTKRK
jgi:hypothetical protein